MHLCGCHCKTVAIEELAYMYVVCVYVYVCVVQYVHNEFMIDSDNWRKDYTTTSLW